MSSRMAASLILGTLLVLAPGAAAQDREILAGSFAMERTEGGPDVFHQSFEVCDPQGSFWLVAENGDPEGGRRVSSARVSLNGAAVILPQELNQQVARVEKPVTLVAQNTLEAELSAAPGAFLTVRIEGFANCLKLEDIQPPSGSVIDGESVYIRGKLRSNAREVVVARFWDPNEPEDGSIVTDGPELVAFGEFALNIALGPDDIEKPFTIYLRARDNQGNTFRTALTYTGTKQFHTFGVRVTPQMTTPGHRVRFAIQDSGTPILPTGQPGTTPARFRIDFDGDGVFDFEEGRDANHFWPDAEHVYEREGFYHVRAELLGPVGEILATGYVPVAIIADPHLDGLFMEMLGRLSAGDLEGALKYIVLNKRDEYRTILTARAARLPGGLAELASRYSGLKLLNVGTGTATYDCTVQGDNVRLATEVHFGQDIDGFMRIADF